MAKCKIIIIGGGIIGLMSAIELRKSGAEVLVLERGQIGQEASWAGGGILSPMHPWNYPSAGRALIDWSQAHYPGLIKETQAATAIDPELENSGMLILDPAQKKRAVEWAKSTGKEIRFIAGDEIFNRVPDLNPAWQDDAIFLPEISQVRNPRLMKALQRYGEILGVNIMTHCEVQQIVSDKKRITGVKTTDQDFHGDVIVVAAGAWSSSLIKPFVPRLEIKPIRGQILLFQGPANKRFPILVRGDHYLIPRRDGRVLAGSTLEDVGFDKSPTAEAYAQLHQAACSMLPLLADCPVEKHWAGLRPGANSPLPVISAVPGHQGLYLNTAHFRNGLLLANGSARLLGDLISGRPPIVNPRWYALS